MMRTNEERSVEPADAREAHVPLGLPSPGETFGEIDLRELLRKVWRRKGVIFGTVVLLTTLAVLVVSQLTPRYSAEAVVMIEPRQSKVVDLEAVIEGLPAESETITTEIEVIRSRGLAEKVITRLGLRRDPEFNADLRPPTWFDEFLVSWGIPINDWLTSWRGKDDENLSDEALQELQRVRVIDAYLEDLDVFSISTSFVIKIWFTSESPETAAKVANTLADFYIVEQLEAKFEATRRATAWLNERVAALREKVDASEKAVEEYRRKSGLLASKGTTIISQQVSELSTQFVLAKAERAEVVARLLQITKLMSSASGVDSAAEVLDSTLIQNLRVQEAEVDRKAAELSQEYGERHPKLINVRAEARNLRAKIDGEVNKIVKGLKNEVGAAWARETSLGRSLEKLKGKIAVANEAEVQLRALDREAQANRTLLATMLTRFKETRAQEDLEAQRPDARLISRADAPELASFPRTGLILSLTLVGSFFIGLLLVFAIEQLDPGFRSGEQIEQQTGFPVLGMVPKLSGRRWFGKAPQDQILVHPASALAESIRTLHTSILLSHAGGPPKRILITSAQPKEGKTTIVTCLARLLAKSGKKVLLIDADLRRPRIHGALGMAQRPGLADLLSGNATREEVIREDKASGAYVMTAGHVTSNAHDILSSRRMKALLLELGLAYDLVIIDSPPISAVSDARLLAREVDRTVFVVRWAETPRAMVAVAIRQLKSSGAELAGVVLSMVDVRKHARYGYGDSGYYYGPLSKYYAEMNPNRRTALRR